MNKFNTYIFCFIVILIGLNFIRTCNDNRKTKDNYMIEEDSCICRINDTIDTIIIEEVDSDDLIQDAESLITEYACTD